MTDDIWEWEDVYQMMTEDVEERKRRERKKRERKHLLLLVGFCAVVLSTVGLVTCGPGDMEMEMESSAGASEGQTFDEWYADENNRAWYEFQQWYSADVRNASYYHVRDEFGTGATGDKAIQIAICESDLNPRAVSHTDDHGTMQLNRPSWERKFSSVTGVSWNEGVYHASYNAQFAKWLYDETGGFSHWACA